MATKNPKNPKNRRTIVKIQTDQKGRRFVIVGKKRFYLAIGKSKSEERDIIRLLLKTWLASQRRRTSTRRKYKKRKKGVSRVVTANPWSSSSTLHHPTGNPESLSTLIHHTDNELHKLQREVKLLKSSEIKHIPALAESRGVPLLHYSGSRGPITPSPISPSESEHEFFMPYPESESAKHALSPLSRRNIKVSQREIQERLELEKQQKQELQWMSNSKKVNEVIHMNGDQLRERLKQIGVNSRGLKNQVMINTILNNEFGGDKNIQTSDDSFYIVGDGKFGSDKGLSNLELDRMMYPYVKKGYLGCISSDEISDLVGEVHPNSRAGFIMNTAPSTKPGIHWLGIYIEGRKGYKPTLEYYNSLGDKDEEAIPKRFLKHIQPLLKEMGIKKFTLKQNSIPDQLPSTSTCGYFAARFLQQRFKGFSFKQASLENMGKGDSDEKHEKDGEEIIKATFEGEPTFESKQQRGKGIFQRVKDVLKGKRYDYPPSARVLLKSHGDEIIKEIMVYKKPIKKFFDTLLNVLSLGQFRRNIKEAGYDNAMHLWMKVRTDKGTSILMEKNHVLKIKQEAWGASDSTASVSIPVKGSISVKDFLNRALEKYGKEAFFIYSSDKNNCQMFLLHLLSASGMGNEESKKFIHQDAEQFYKNTGLLSKIAKGVTDVAHVADVIQNGQGYIPGDSRLTVPGIR